MEPNLNNLMTRLKWSNEIERVDMSEGVDMNGT